MAAHSSATTCWTSVRGCSGAAGSAAWRAGGVPPNRRNAAKSTFALTVSGTLAIAITDTGTMCLGSRAAQ